ncbi:hypothetical protein ABEB36_007275 [Hypothenemus hampei]|uniref:Cytochrome P450 n=1 Tax=Hypothenemus hampei TaxID=57062 RepID=A0ABD1EUA6_HYPHA
MPISILTTILIIILTLLIVAVAISYYKSQKSECVLKPPSPWLKLPLIGHLHLLHGYEVPYQAFTELGRKYGNVVGLQLGQVKCVVVNEQKNIRETLVTRGSHFDYRPNFERYRRLFSGNKENSLAFCDWSKTQKIRRDMLKAYTFPRAFTNNYHSLDELITNCTQEMLQEFGENPLDLKPIFLRCCARIFLLHFCSRNFHMEADFLRMINNFDEVFFEVNQGYAADFLPFLMPLHKKKMQKLNEVTSEIRQFINDRVIGDKFQVYNPDLEHGDYLESLIGHVKKESIDWETALFALEDIIGGHSAVGNFLTKLFGYLVNEPEVQKKIQDEIDLTIGKERPISIYDRNQLVYIEATVFEAIRMISSPIVPRVANQTSSIGGYQIEKGTVIFLNNYNLSMSNDLWENPEKFCPERFVKNGKLYKPDYFLPFGGGRRSCMGYKLVQLVSFGILGSVMQNFDVKPVKNERYQVQAGSLALGKDSFKFMLEQRKR